MFNKSKPRSSFNGALIEDSIKYLFSIIIPGLLGFSLIPIMKSGLGTKDYGYYSFLMNGLLIFSSVGSSWFTTSIIRNYAYFSKSKEFLKKVAKTSVIISIFFSTIALVTFFNFTKSSHIAVTLCIATLITIMLNISISLNQASFLAHNIIVSESIRTILFFSIAIFLISFSKNNTIIKIFYATIVSNLFSILFLFKKWKAKNSNEDVLTENDEKTNYSIKSILNYGWPIFFWTLMFMLIPYFDKIMVRIYLGSTVQGEYQAIFDLIFKTLLTVSNPILVASLPHFAKVTEGQNTNTIFAIIKKIILLEVVIIIILSLIYFLLGGTLILNLLKIDTQDNSYLLCGFYSFLAACTWHVGMLLHKILEIKNRTKDMLLNILLAFLVNILSLAIIIIIKSPIYFYPISIMISGFVYILLCLRIAGYKNSHQ